jgi:tRNA uridine 5-carbamoylmethylation protein Kti12
MPLVVFSGLPAAGKTFIATQLVSYLQQHVQDDVVHITEATVNVDRLEGYKSELLVGVWRFGPMALLTSFMTRQPG